MSADPSVLPDVAVECVNLVETRFGRELDGSVGSLEELDTVCAELIADGPLDEREYRLWWWLAGVYTGEVLRHAHGGRWVKDSSGGYAVEVYGRTGFPLDVAARVLSGEPHTSFVAFARSLPGGRQDARPSR